MLPSISDKRGLRVYSNALLNKSRTIVLNNGACFWGKGGFSGNRYYGFGYVVPTYLAYLAPLLLKRDGQMVFLYAGILTCVTSGANLL